MIDLTKITTPFCLLSEETQEALKSLPRGEVEFLVNRGYWAVNDFPSFIPNYVYRRRPKAALIVPSAVWAVLSEEYDWAATDHGGDIYAYAMEPEQSSGFWRNHMDDDLPPAEITHLVGVEADPKRWRESLIRRPEGV